MTTRNDHINAGKQGCGDEANLEDARLRLRGHAAQGLHQQHRWHRWATRKRVVLRSAPSGVMAVLLITKRVAGGVSAHGYTLLGMRASRHVSAPQHSSGTVASLAIIAQGRNGSGAATAGRQDQELNENMSDSRANSSNRQRRARPVARQSSTSIIIALRENSPKHGLGGLPAARRAVRGPAIERFVMRCRLDVAAEGTVLAPMERDFAELLAGVDAVATADSRYEAAW